MRKLFRGGVHLPSEKRLTEDKPITPFAAPETVRVPLVQHIGKPSRFAVRVGDEVKKGQLIGEADGAISAATFSPVSGTVSAVVKLRTATGECDHVVIENDGKDEEFRFKPIEDENPEMILARVAEAGIVGMGGAGFPSAVKLKAKAETLIINAAECEPYVTCDYRVILDYTDEFLRGVELARIACCAKNAIIAIEDNKPKAIELLRAKGADVRVLPERYPQGAEKQLIKAVTGKTVPLGKLPASLGLAVGNVSTALAIKRAVDDGIPCYERAVTVTGRGIVEPRNLWVRTGTSFSDLIEGCGGFTDDAIKLVSGGPMMGFALSNADVYATKTSGCVLALTADETSVEPPSPCIGCARCVKACPMRLVPTAMEAAINAGRLDEAAEYGLTACVECGCCAFVCPACRPLVQTFKRGKKLLRGRKSQ